MSARVTLPEKQYRGYIFDLDGTLVDSMGLHHRAWKETLNRHGAPSHIFEWDEFVAYGGRAAIDIVGALNVSYKLQLDPECVADDKRTRYMELLESEQLRAIAETEALIYSLRSQEIPYAVGTGSAMEGALATLRSARMAGLFDIIVTPQDVPAGRGKPKPDIFLLCAERMGVDARDCVVFEDAQPGIDAACAAGMDYVIVREA